MMSAELFGHVTFETHFLEFRLLAGTVQGISPGITVQREIKILGNNERRASGVLPIHFSWDCS